MCVLSMVYREYGDEWQKKFDDYFRSAPFTPYIPIVTIPEPKPCPITDEEIAEFRMWLEKAREFDKKFKQPDCADEEKKKKILELAEKLGIKEKVNFL